MTLACSGISVRYGALPALSDLSLAAGEGEIRALIGPNGSGKSTALHVLAGLIRPTAGRVTLDDRPLGTWRRRDIAKRMSFLPQAPIAPDEMSVEQLVRQGRFAHVGLLGRYRPEDRDAVLWALECTGLTELAGRPLRELSGGERQRAWIAAALAQEAAILLLDEPTSFLDIGHQVDLLNLVHRLSRERQVTVVMAIHDLNQALMVADRITLLGRGTLQFDGTPQLLAESGLIEKTFGVRGRFGLQGAGDRPYFRVELT